MAAGNGTYAGRAVEVAIPRPVWKTFCYLMPQELDGGVIQGCRVAVPFGASRLVGFVLGTWKAAPPKELKPILERLDSTPLLPGKVLELVKWAAGYYQAPPGMMHASAHPPGMSGRTVRFCSQVGNADGSRISAILLKAGDMPIDRLKSSLPESYPLEARLAELESEGRIRTWWEPVDQPRPVRERMVEILAEASDAVRIAERIRSRAPKQAEILFELATSSEPVPRREVLRRTSSTSSSLASLKMKGLIKEFYREVSRDPLQHLDRHEDSPLPVLTDLQKIAVDAVTGNLGSGGTFLIHGATGSGKTEIYMRVISEVLNEDRGALVLVPEISLTPLLVSRFHRRFPGKVAVLHSALSRGERLDSWNMVRSGKKPIVIGARSAIFAPLEKTGVIVVDEEHDSSYKQNELPRYNGRDLAVMRGVFEGIPVILGSASPSMESYANATSGKYRLIELPDRILSRPMPVTTIVPSGSMSHPLLSDELLLGIGKRTARGEQSIVLINRRGFAPTQICRNCGHREKCPRCGVTLTYHRKGESLRCHYCSFWRSALNACPECGNEDFAHMGPGIQKVEEALKKYLPDTRVIRMDSDTTRGRRAHWKILESFAKGEGDVLLGTQMVAKGHDFPNVTLVGIIAADMGLSFPDFRSAERVFQLILQVAGRAGRADIPGQVVVQTTDPDDPVILAACNHDFGRFWELEVPVRRTFRYPPFGNLVRFVWSGLRQEEVMNAALICCTDLDVQRTELFPPQEAAFPRINRRWRWSTIGKSPTRAPLAALSAVIRSRFENGGFSGIRLDIDVDPYNLL